MLKDIHGDVGGQVVDPIDRLAQPDGQRLRRGNADEQGPGQARACSHSDSIDVAQGHSRIAAGALERGNHGLKVSPRGDLGDDPAKAGMLVDRTGHGVDQQGAPPDDPDPGLVAGRLDPQDERLVVHGSLRRRTRASTSPGW
ncbi:MAG: hypothetical protein BWY91_03136 [bacterium ADurb.BinA028]|nr:MAG: hypothetical protein BWY91_03136 [bacterium ADurb.BinA028]